VARPGGGAAPARGTLAATFGLHQRFPPASRPPLLGSACLPDLVANILIIIQWLPAAPFLLDQHTPGPQACRWSYSNDVALSPDRKIKATVQQVGVGGTLRSPWTAALRWLT
jgi:hypothetical protein